MATTTWQSGIEANSSNYVFLDNFSVSINRINSNQVQVSCSGTINVTGNVLDHGDNTGTYSARHAYIDTDAGLITIPNIYSASPTLNTGQSRSISGSTTFTVGASRTSITINSVRLRCDRPNPNFTRQPLTWAYDYTYLNSSWDTLQRLSNGGSSPTLYFGAGETTPPTIHRAIIDSQSSSSYHVLSYITDNVGVATPKCAVWTQAGGSGGQDDLKWYDMWSGSWTVGGQAYNYVCVVNRSDHNSEYGTYINHVYAYDISGNESMVQVDCYYTSTITFDANGGNTPSQTSKNVNFGTKFGTMPTTSRTGYTFNGWWTSKTGGTKITANSTMTFTKNTTLYAHWTANVYTLTYDGNGGETPAAKRITYDQKYGELAVSTRSRYEFLGWFTDPVNGTQVTADTICKGNITVYAHWKIKILLGRVLIATEQDKFRYTRPYIMTENGWQCTAVYIGDGSKFNPTALKPDDFKIEDN